MPRSLMPVIDLDRLSPVLSDPDLALVRGIVARQGKNAGRLRASKPPVTFARTVDAQHMWHYEPTDPEAGKTAYLWRMVAFYVSPLPVHHCMPTTADFDLPGSYEDRRQLVAVLDRLVDIVVNSIPKDQWAGVRRWGQAFGQLGTPTVQPDGSIVYR